MFLPIFQPPLGVVPGESRPGESRGISKFGLPVPRGKLLPFPGEKRGKYRVKTWIFKQNSGNFNVL